MPRRPGLAWKALIAGKQRVLAECLEFRELAAAQAAAILQPGARSVRHPQFDHSDEGVHRHPPLRGTLRQDDHQRSEGAWLAQIAGETCQCLMQSREVVRAFDHAAPFSLNMISIAPAKPSFSFEVVTCVASFLTSSVALPIAIETPLLRNIARSFCM